ncbi:Alpha/beta-Hydrolases superfamily protein, putative [Theobroma cacao]|uniref:Alpha/beta-Hydrolases superfamily protein, putative n=1 Tax=Theobroma cacao TaxID=3641 RepID=A0A061DXG1_THECC|nr:Alpha/beta-Hydrolases superfamily protein, putative [Theobroma cacao]
MMANDENEVKHLEEDGANTPLVGAASCMLSSGPLDISLSCLVLQIGKALKRHSISNSVRDFDNHATRVLGKFETLDTYYRRSSSINYVENVSVPLHCVSSLDVPLCTSEAIPWDECSG